MFYEQFLQKETVTGMIFDVDGTLLDSMPIWAHSGEQYLATLGIEAPASLGRVLFSMTMSQGAEYIKEKFALSQTAQEIQGGIIQIVEDAYRTKVGFKKSALEFLQKLQEAGIPMVIVTSNEEALVRAALRRLGAEHYFQEILTSGGFGSGKDSPDIFYAAAAQMGSSIGSTWVLEDALYAISTARKAGFRTIGVADAASREDEAQIRGLADYFIADYGTIAEEEIS